MFQDGSSQILKRKQVFFLAKKCIKCTKGDAEMHENTVTNLSWESSLLNIGTVQSNSKNSSWKSWMANILHDHDKWQTTLKLVVLRVCLIYTSSIRVSHQTVAVIKPDQLHVHVMIIMFINSLRHVFYHVHSCSCHVYIASSSWALNTLTFAEFLFLQVSRPTRFRPRMCFRQGIPTQIHENVEGWDVCLTWTNSKNASFFFSSKMRRIVLKTYRDPFCENGVFNC